MGMRTAPLWVRSGGASRRSWALLLSASSPPQMAAPQEWHASCECPSAEPPGLCWFRAPLSTTGH